MALTNGNGQALKIILTVAGVLLATALTVTVGVVTGHSSTLTEQGKEITEVRTKQVGIEKSLDELKVEQRASTERLDDKLDKILSRLGNRR